MLKLLIGVVAGATVGAFATRVAQAVARDPEIAKAIDELKDEFVTQLKQAKDKAAEAAKDARDKAAKAAKS